MFTTEYDGCGKCLVGVRRLSRKVDATNSPEKQETQVLDATRAVGGHIIAWADDWEVSGATDPLTRPALGPWLRGEKGPYSGIAGPAVDRIGRNQRDVLNTGYMIKDAGMLLVTYGHDGPWDLDDPVDEMRFSMEAFGAQMELRAIQRRNREETVRAREAGTPKQKNAYGYRYVRLHPAGKVERVEIDPVAAEIIRTVARRILADETGTVTCATKAARLTRAGVPTPSRHRATLYGREPEGPGVWEGRVIKRMLISEAALGFLMHKGRPVLGADGHSVRLAEPLWDRATHDALIAKTASKRNTGGRAQKGARLLSGRAFCGNCDQRLYVLGRAGGLTSQYGCNGRVRGVPASADCRPAPTMLIPECDQKVAAWFLAEYGHIQQYRKEYDPGTGHAARIADLEADRRRLRGDRAAGLYDSADDEAWFRREYARMGAEIDRLRVLPDRPAGMRWVRLDQTVGEQWLAAADDAARREMLAQYEVRVTLKPVGSPLRVHVTGVDMEALALEQAAAAEQARIDAEFAFEIAEAAADIADQMEVSADGVAEFLEDSAESLT
ncbi:recombinase family protein [Streptomyces tateyamensis]|uniref:Recombinase family protein n=1 Tax=Streptomyces tateyamensis TaxID=565073 RepID=A0A2V4NE55_9ACTN|nr:recombinase family protein [Streptomyces tateyamensis]PYC77476.1 recombinase family protein [Streptomyces tateyamensis]